MGRTYSLGVDCFLNIPQIAQFLLATGKCDTTNSLAARIAASKLHVDFIHILCDVEH